MQILFPSYSSVSLSTHDAPPNRTVYRMHIFQIVHTPRSLAAGVSATCTQPHHLIVHVEHTGRTDRSDAGPARRRHHDRPRRIQQLEHLRPRLHARRRPKVQPRVHGHGRDDGAVARGADLHPLGSRRQHDRPGERVRARGPPVGLRRAAARGVLKERLVPHRSDGRGAGRGRHGVAGFVGGDEGRHERLPGRVGEVGLGGAVLDR